jgi:hypothetical protein
LTETRSAASRCQRDPGDFQQIHKIICLVVCLSCASAHVHGRRRYGDAAAMLRSTALRSIKSVLNVSARYQTGARRKWRIKLKI